MSGSEGGTLSAIDALGLIEELEAELDAVNQERHAPIAVVGMACRFPGAPGDPDSYWRMLREGGSGVREVPSDRWDIDQYFAEKLAPGKMTTRAGGFLDEVRGFDAGFFDIREVEAQYLDPQQRMLLEVTWEALEHGGIRPSDLRGGRAGVFVGASAHDFEWYSLKAGPTRLHPFTMSGVALSVAAGRISYALDLRGPCLQVDTACSSSLVSTHLACLSLRANECDVALAAGVNLILAPEPTIVLSQMGAMSPRGLCSTFDAAADGYVRGEGSGVLVLKRLSDALAAGDRVLAVIRGTAINHDGRSNGLTAPNGLAQQAVIREALRDASLEPADVDYIEAHGTGTPLGDPIEYEALAATVGASPREKPAWVGSVKTNIGHLEGAAGVASLVKVITSFERGEIPGQIHFKTMSPYIAPSNGLRVASAAVPFARTTRPRVVGVSSFGISGTNAHTVLSEPPAEEAERAPVGASPPFLALPISAKSAPALDAYVRRYIDFLGAGLSESALRDVCHTAATRRDHFAHRACVTGKSAEELLQRLRALAAEGKAPGSVRGLRKVAGPPKVAWVFSGQGPQWWRMGRDLLARGGTFARTVGECSRAIEAASGWSVLDELAKTESTSRLGETAVAQAALFSLQVGLARQLEAWGLSPDAVVGHSIGEIAAAHVAGALSLEQASRLVAARGRAMQAAHGLGKMATVELSREEAESVVHELGLRLSVAAVNGPRSSVLAGEAQEVARLVASLVERRVYAKELPVDYAFHSAQMEDIAKGLKAQLEWLRPSRTKTRMVSTSTPDVTAEYGPDYWSEQVRRPVRFWDAIERLLAERVELFVEIGPHPVLATTIAEGAASKGAEVSVVATLRRNEPDDQALGAALAAIHCAGGAVDWGAVHGFKGRVTSLPSYPWQKKPYWLPFSTRDSARASVSSAEHPMLRGHRQPPDRPGSHAWETPLVLDDFPYLRDHVVRSILLVPGSFFFAAATAAAREAFGERFRSLDASIALPLMPSETDPPTLRISIDAPEQGRATFRLSTRTKETPEWSLHVEGTIHLSEAPRPEAPRVDVVAARERCNARVWAGSELYELGSSGGFGVSIGPTFQHMSELRLGAGEAIGRLHYSSTVEGELEAYGTHPVPLDAGIFGAAFMATARTEDVRFPHLPVGSTLEVFGDVTKAAWVRVELPADSLKARVQLLDEAGVQLLELRDLRLERVARTVSDLHFGVSWRPAPRADVPTDVSGTYALLADEGGTAQAVARELSAQGVEVISIRRGARFEQTGPSSYAVDPRRAEDFRELTRALAKSGRPPAVFVHMWSLDLKTTSSEPDLAEARTLGPVSALHLTQALVATRDAPPPHLVLVTRGAQAVASDDVALLQTPLLGFAATVTGEAPELACRQIDLDAGDPASFARELLTPTDETCVALRGGQRFVPRLTSSDPASLSRGESPLRSDATYLVTGGLGGVGAHIVRSMVAKGAGAVVVLGRRPDSDREIASGLAAFAEAGARVSYRSVDVADRSAVAAAVADIERASGPVAGVVHAAGALDDALLQDLDAPRFSGPVWGSKVDGAWNLHAATLHRKLDFFVLFSSITSTFGSPGQANYASANAFLDGLAHHRRVLGLSSCAIHWGPWAKVGMAAGRALAIPPISVDEGVQAFEALLGSSVAEAFVLRPPAELLRDRQLLPRLFHELAPPAGPEAQAPSAAFEAIRATPPGEERAALVERFLKERVGRSLQRDVSHLSSDTPFARIGLDSLMTMELRNEIARHGVRLTATDFIHYPSIGALAALIARGIDTADASATKTEPQAATVAKAPRPAIVARQGTSRTLRANGFDHHVTEWSPERPSGTALLIHGFMDAGATWDLVAPSLNAVGLRVVAPDLRGFGETGRTPSGTHYHFPDFVGDVAGIARAVAQGERLFVVGHSLGGTIALYFAGAFPEMVAKLALVEGLGNPENAPTAAPDLMRQWVEDVEHFSAEGVVAPIATLDDVRRYLKASHPRVSDEVIASRAPLLVRPRGDGALEWRSHALHRSVVPTPYFASVQAAFAARVSSPVLTVSGGPNGFHVADEKARISAFADVTSVELADAGHMVHWTEPEALGRALADFWIKGSPTDPRG